MIEKHIFENNLKGSETASHNVLMNDEGIKPYESIKERNKEAKKRIIIMNEKDDIINSANSKRSNENILLLKKNKFGRNIYSDEYIDKIETYFNTKNNFNTNNKLSIEEVNNNETLNDISYDNNIGNYAKNKNDDIYQKKEEEIDINEIFNLLTGYDIYKKIKLNHLKKFFFESIPEGLTLNTNLNKIKKENKDNNTENFNYNLEILRNNKIYFFAKIKQTFPSLNIKIFIKAPNEQYIKVGKIISNVLKNNFILYEGNNKNNYKKVLNINYDLNFFGWKVRNMTVEKIVNDKIKYILCNDSPEWDIEYKTYKLNFNGRVKKSCKKNFILKLKNSNLDKNEKNNEENENYNNERILQCGKIDDYCFALDFISPLSPFEAFSLSISSIIYKISCE